jgi:hypothetical protein
MHTSHPLLLGFGPQCLGMGSNHPLALCGCCALCSAQLLLVQRGVLADLFVRLTWELAFSSVVWFWVVVLWRTCSQRALGALLQRSCLHQRITESGICGVCQIASFGVC